VLGVEDDDPPGARGESGGDQVPGEAGAAPRPAQRDFYVVPARTGESLSPIDVTLRRIARPELPSPHARALKWSVPMRPGERKRYAKKIPVLGPFLSQAKACRYWYLSCGAVFSEVDATTRQGAQIRNLSFSQPSRFAAPTGILMQTDTVGLSPRRFGFDIQVRQDHRLIARYRRAGVCRDAPGSLGGVVNDCEVSVVKNSRVDLPRSRVGKPQCARSRSFRASPTASS
jgi:hypothetical protein